MGKKRLRKKLDFVIFCCIILFVLFTRFWNLTTNPEWYPDECGNLNQAWSLVHGQPRLWAIKCDFIKHPPLFFLISGALMLVFGKSLLVLRTLAAIYGVLTAILLFFIGKYLYPKNTRTGLLCSALFALCPMTILYNRWGFDYNQLMFLGLLSFYFCLRYLKTKETKWLYWASVGAGLSIATLYYGVVFFFGVIVCQIVSDGFKPSKILKVVAIGLSPLFIQLISMALYDHEFLILSISDVYSHRFAGGSFKYFFRGLPGLFTSSWWIPWGTIGLFFIKGRQRLWTVLSFFIPSVVLVVKLRCGNLGQFFYPYLSFIGFIMVGIGILLVSIYDYLEELLRRRYAKGIVPFKCFVFAVAGLVVIYLSYCDLYDVQNGFFYPFKETSVARSPDDTMAVAGFINRNTENQDSVIATSLIGWLINCNVAPLGQALAYEGRPTFFYQSKMKKEYFFYDCSFPKAKFFVLDQFTRASIIRCEFLNDEDRQYLAAKLKNWPLVFQHGEYNVFRNPEQH